MFVVVTFAHELQILFVFGCSWPSEKEESPFILLMRQKSETPDLESPFILLMHHSGVSEPLYPDFILLMRHSYC